MQHDAASPTDIRELAEVPPADWQALFAGEADPFRIGHLRVSWRPKDLHFVLYLGGRAASHVSMVLRHSVRVEGERVAVSGVSGVVTRPDLRRRGLAAGLLAHAIRATRPRAGTAFALLFCLPDLVSLYRGLGWVAVSSAVRVEQPGGVIDAPLPAMALSLQATPWPGGAVWLDSLPW